MKQFIARIRNFANKEDGATMVESGLFLRLWKGLFRPARRRSPYRGQFPALFNIERLEERVLLSVDPLQLTGVAPSDRWIAVLRDDVDPTQFAQQLQERGGRTVSHVFSHAVRAVAFRGEALGDDPRIAYMEADLSLHVTAQSLPTGVNRINADLNNIAKIDGLDERVDVDIAILDTGIDTTHSDLNVHAGRNFTGGSDADSDDRHGHGTHVAGIAAALDNDSGVMGVAPGARLWAAKVLGDDGSGYLSDVISGVDWVTVNADEIEIANLSLGGTGQSSLLRSAIQNSVAAGVVYIAAAGNSGIDVYGVDGVFGTSDDALPASYPEVMTVSAFADSDGQSGGTGSSTSFGSDDSFASFSNFSTNVISGNPVNSPGAAIDLVMPGVNIHSTYKDGQYAILSGTSMAAPHAAGLAALYIAANGRDQDGDGDHDAQDVSAIRQALIDSGIRQGASDGLAEQNDPDGNKETIGWAETIDDGTMLSINGVSMLEGDSGTTYATFTVTLNNDVDSSFTVDYATADGTATTADGDYTAASGTLTFAGNAGETQTFTVAVNGDGGFELDETFFVNLSSVQAAGLDVTIDNGQGVATLTTDDRIAVGADTGGGPHVKVINPVDETEVFSFFAYDGNFRGGVRVATADVNNDGTADIITAPGAGGGPHVRVFDGVTGSQLTGAIGSFFAYDAGFAGGVFVAAADINNDGFADIVTGAGAGGGPHVKVFSGADGSLLASFFAYAPAFTGGVHVAIGDVNHDETPDIITGAGAGGGAHVRVFDGTTFTPLNGPIGSFFAYDAGFTGGVFVAAADINGDGFADIATGAGAGGGPHVKVFSGADGSVLRSFFAYDASFTNGVRVAINGAEIVTAIGSGSTSDVRTFETTTLDQLTSNEIFAGFSDGEFVAANSGLANSGGGDTLLAAGSAASVTTDSALLETSQLVPLISESLSRWQAAGVSDADLSRLADVEVAVADLSGARLGLATDDAIFIDINAAGYGWFVDPTPGLDEEFSPADGVLTATVPAAENDVDLLSVLVHEFGHHLGLADIDDLSHPMGHKLGVGIRRVDFAREELFANGDLLAEVLS